MGVLMRTVAVAILCAVSTLAQYTPPSGTGSGGFVYTGVLSGIPATCTVGQVAFITDAAAGQNQYNCAATNTWTQNLNSGSGGASVALDNLGTVSINKSLLFQTGLDVGSTTKPARNIFLFGAGTYSTTYIELTGTPTSTRVWTFPDSTDTVVGLAATQTLTNKTFTAPVLGAATATSINKVAITAPASSATLTIPDGVTFTGPPSSGTAATLAGTETFTNKTLTTPALTTPKVTTINDANGNPFLASSATASAVDSITVTNAATANPATVTLGATGSDSNINLSLVGKGTGGVQFLNGASTGTSPPAVTAGTGGVQAFAEGTVPTVCAASAVDCLYANSTQHGFLASFNNGTFLPLPQGPASTTSSDLACWNATNGGLLKDCTVLPNGTTASTQSAGSNDTKVATDAYVDATKCTTTITTGTTATLSTCFTVNQEATAGTGVTYTLPTAASGLQYCIDNSWNGSAANTGVLTFATSASGQFMVYTDGTLTATGGNVTSGGAARDGACVYGIDATHWMFLPHAGVWTKH